MAKRIAKENLQPSDLEPTMPSIPTMPPPAPEDTEMPTPGDPGAPVMPPMPETPKPQARKSKPAGLQIKQTPNLSGWMIERTDAEGNVDYCGQSMGWYKKPQLPDPFPSVSAAKFVIQKFMTPKTVAAPQKTAENVLALGTHEDVEWLTIRVPVLRKSSMPETMYRSQQINSRVNRTQGVVVQRVLLACRLMHQKSAKGSHVEHMAHVPTFLLDLIAAEAEKVLADS